MVVDDLSYWRPDPAERNRLEAVGIADHLDRAADGWPDRPALAYSADEPGGVEIRWTFSELRERAIAVAKAFIGAGMAHGERFAVYATNSPEYILLQLGASYVGCVMVPLNPLYRERELHYCLEKVEASACFAVATDRGTDLWSLLQRVAERAPALRLTVAIGDLPDDPTAVSFDRWLTLGDDVSSSELLRRRRRLNPRDVSQIQYTSGTTGFPKAVVLTGFAFANMAAAIAQRAAIHEGGRFVNPMPFFHSSGCIAGHLVPLVTGTVHLPMLKFDAVHAARTIDREQATSLLAVPTMLLAIEEAADLHSFDLRSLRVVLSGGSLVPEAVARRWSERYGVAFSIVYGMTEMSPLATQGSPADPLELQVGTVGRPIPATELEVVVPGETTRVRLGEEGELRFRGWSQMLGYYGDPESTKQAVDADGWLRSGDLGYMTPDGYVRVTGRAKDLIIRGGENIPPAAVEDAIRQYFEEVADVSVVGVPDERYGEEVCAFVRLHDGRSLTIEDVRARLTDRIARFMIPRHVQVVAELPTTQSGKVQKFLLREMWLEATSAERDQLEADRHAS